MSTGGTGGHPTHSFDIGAMNAQHNVDLSDDPDPKGTAAGYIPDQNQGQSKSLLSSIKDAFKPNDTKNQQPQQGTGLHGDYTHDGRHGGIEETMQRGHRDYDESQEGPASHRDGMRTSNAPMVPDSLKMSAGRRDPGSVRGGGGDSSRVSAFDSQGSVGHQFTSEGAIGGTAQKIGGPFSKEGAVGRQFTDKGSVGGTVQDTMGHGNATRKGA
ncbi:hypothetical protein M426DRAFT_323932 [Hypoxylon sp. CI-4A]|nr:hypothetical protein M426DRAFT_323932 [Hypoxylon sp. CI-4A]